MAIMQIAAQEAESTPPLDPWSTFLVVTFWPVIAISMAYVALIVISIAAWLWGVVVAPIDLNWLTPIVEQAVDKQWWKAASIRIASQSPWVMPSLLATTIGLCAAIFALPRPDPRTYFRLASIAILVASGASLWAWIALPSAALSKDKDPVPAISTATLAVVIAILAALTGSFIRSRDSKMDLLENRSLRLHRDVESMEALGWVPHRPHPWVRLIVVLFAPAIVITFAQVPILRVANQEGEGLFFLFNITIGVVAWLVSIAASWPKRNPRNHNRLWIELTRLVLSLIAGLFPFSLRFE